MKYLGVIAVLLALAAGAFLYKKYRIPPNMEVLNVPLQTLDGESFSWSEFEGKTVLVNYWQTWCADCLKEMPGLDRVRAQMAGSNFEIVLVSDEDPELQKRFRDSRGFGLRYLYTPSLSELGVFSYPTTYVFDKNGNTLLAEVLGKEWDTEAQIAQFKDWAAE